MGFLEYIPKRELLERRLLRPVLSGEIDLRSAVNTWERTPEEDTSLRLGRGWVFYSTYLGEEANEAVSEAGETVEVQEFSIKNLWENL